jgi:membrane protein
MNEAGPQTQRKTRRETRLRAARHLLQLTWREWWRDNPFRLAASLAFYTTFSLAPVLLIAVGIGSLFLARQTVIEQLIAEMQQLIGPEGARAIQQVLEAARGFGKGIQAIAIGAITFLLGATAVFGELQSELNLIWDVEADPKRGLLVKLILDRLRSFSLALAVGFLLLVSLVISAALSGLEGYLDAAMPLGSWIWHAVNLLTSFLVVALLFAMIYKFLPDVHIVWKDVWIGAGVTSLLFTVGKYAIGVYLGRTAMTSAYGAAGSFAVLLLWVYYSALISFFGAEFTQVYARRCGSKIQPKRQARRVGRKADAID